MFISLFVFLDLCGILNIYILIIFVMDCEMIVKKNLIKIYLIVVGIEECIGFKCLL